MPFYTKSPKESVLDLIKEANPNLPLPLTANGVTFGTPKVIPLTPGNVTNTEVEMFASGGSGYIKKTTVKYRRLSLDTLFRGLDAEVYKYSAKGPLEFPFDVFGLLKEVNKRFGLNLTEADVLNSWFPWENDKYYPDKRTCVAMLAAKSSSLCWVGQTSLRWVSDRQSIADMVTTLELPGRAFPGGGKTASPKYTLDCATYDADFGEFTSVMGDVLLTNSAFGTDTPEARPVHEAVLAAINEVTGETYSFDAPPAEFGLGGIVPVRYNLPNAAVPEANAKDYNRVVVFNYPVDGVWGVGRLLLHYND